MCVYKIILEEKVQCKNLKIVFRKWRKQEEVAGWGQGTEVKNFKTQDTDILFEFNVALHLVSMKNSSNDI